MINEHLHCLHLFGTTPDEKINSIADIRLGRLLKELKTQEITDYSIIGGYYDPFNTKQAIHKGHKAIVQSAKDKGLPNCIIAEDDIKFSSPNSYKYFLSQIPEFYDIFSGLIYAGAVEHGRVMNGASGIMTLYSIHNRFYDFFLSLDVNTHVDREIGLTAFEHEYFVCEPMVVEQRGGYSFNRRQILFYDVYLEGKVLFGQ